MDDLAREVLRQVVVARPCDVVALVGPCFDTEEETRRRRVRRDARLRVLHLEECTVEDDGRDSRVWCRLATFDDADAAACRATRSSTAPPISRALRTWPTGRPCSCTWSCERINLRLVSVPRQFGRVGPVEQHRLRSAFSKHLRAVDEVPYLTAANSSTFSSRHVQTNCGKKMRYV